MKATSTVATEYRIGEKVPGTNWVVRSVLGRGGMGVVLDVEKEASGLRMAMKVVHPAFARSGEFTERFLEEVRLLSALRHPNIVDVTDCDTLADGSPYIMMERLEGRTLRQALSDSDIVFAAENVWNIIGQLCSALHCAHTARPPIVHRDVKPANVFLHDRRHFVSNVKLIDFGVSALVDEKRAAGAPMGTARYMAPEACRGEAPTPRADAWTEGASSCCCCGGRSRSRRLGSWLSMEPWRCGHSAAGGCGVAVVLEPAGHAPGGTTRRAPRAHRSRGRRARRTGEDHRLGRRDSRRIREIGRSTGVGQWRPRCLAQEAAQDEQGVERPGGA